MDTTSILSDPNVVYMVLWVGLWITVTAAHAPGTTVIEVLSLLVLAVAVVLLVNMPTNWLAVLLFAAGVVGFILIPFFNQQYTRLSLTGLIFQAIGGYFLFHGLQVSPLVVGTTIGLSLIYHYFVLLPALQRIRLYKQEDPDTVLIGATGRVVVPLAPIGTVQVNSERWSATSNQDIPAGTHVIVLERNGLQLLVEPAKDKRQPAHVQNGNSVEAENDDIVQNNGMI